MTADTGKTRFNIGDWIVHYYHGVGQVENIVIKGLDGNQKKYYKVSTKNIDYWIPFEDEGSDHIEPIRPKSKFNTALKIVEMKPHAIANHHKSRKKKINDRWMIGSLKSRAELLRDLHGRMKLQKLSFSEKEMFHKVRESFISEWLISDENLTRKQAGKRLRMALKTSATKGKKAMHIEK